MARCDDCGKTTKFKMASLIGGLTLCEECAKPEAKIETPASSNELKFDDLNVVGIDKEDIPDEIKQMILKKIEETGVDPEDGVFIAVKHDSEKGGDDVRKKLRIIQAREDFGTATSATLSTLHHLMHAGVPKVELESMIRAFTKFQREVVIDYLFKDDPQMDKGLEEITALNYDLVLNCEEDDDD